MDDWAAIHERGRPASDLAARPRLMDAALGVAWSFIYIFFTNGTPYDAPNRSEPCPSG
jgi:hypothetical protein